MELKRVVGTPDYRGIIDLVNAEWPPEFGEADDDAKIRSLVESHNPDTDTVKYLVDGERIVGFYRYSLWPRDAPVPRRAHVYDIALLPEYRGRGLGIRLMQDMAADCRRRGLAELLSRTFRTNEASIRLHRAFGFSVHLETDDSIVWSLDLIGRPS